MELIFLNVRVEKSRKIFDNEENKGGPCIHVKQETAFFTTYTLARLTAQTLSSGILAMGS